MPETLNRHYEQLKRLGTQNLGGEDVADLITTMAQRCSQILGPLARVGLTSGVPNKQYFGWRRDQVISRPINDSLYVFDEAQFNEMLLRFRDGFAGTLPEDISRATYSIAFRVFAANDVYGVGRKASATFFEILVGHLVARTLNISPRKKVKIPESTAFLPTDYVFDPGPTSRKIHLPIKTSTRERAVQAWVHHLILDRIFGTGQFRGVLVCAAETKRNTVTGAVVEICIPRQLQMFQTRVAEISRVYYLDPPEPYLALANVFPRIEVRSFGAIFEELPALLET